MLKKKGRGKTQGFHIWSDNVANHVLLGVRNDRDRVKLI